MKNDLDQKCLHVHRTSYIEHRCNVDLTTFIYLILGSHSTDHSAHFSLCYCLPWWFFFIDVSSRELFVVVCLCLFSKSLTWIGLKFREIHFHLCAFRMDFYFFLGVVTLSLFIPAFEQINFNFLSICDDITFLSPPFNRVKKRLLSMNILDDLSFEDNCLFQSFEWFELSSRH